MGGVATLVSFTPVSGSITPQASYICIGFLANNRVFLQLRRSGASLLAHQMLTHLTN